MVVIGPGQPGLIAGKYQIERLIGKGGMAEVFAAVNVRTGKRVALKRINPQLAATDEARARFKREALAAGRINHPNVVTVFDVVEHQGATCLVMELLEGETLSQLLLRTKTLTPEVAIAVLVPALRGVAAAHAHGVVHRDLKPDNIFLCKVSENQRGEAKVLDFGVSKLATEGDDVNITATGGLVGTPIYMAPEQVRGGKEIDQRTDVYTLGCVLYQMLAGRPPYQGEIYSALMVTIATQDAPRLRSLRPELPVELEKIVHRAMARDVDTRFPDVASFIRALENFIQVEHPGSGAVQVPAQTTTDRTIKLLAPRTNWSKRIFIGVVAVVVILATKFIIDARYPVPVRNAGITTNTRLPPITAVSGGSAPAATTTPTTTGETAMTPRPPANPTGPGVEGSAPPAVAPTSAAPTAPPPQVAPDPPLVPTPVVSASKPRDRSSSHRSSKTAEPSSSSAPPATPNRTPTSPPPPPSRAGRITIDDF